MSATADHVQVLVAGPTGISGLVSCVCCLEEFRQSEIDAHDLDLLGFVCCHCTPGLIRAEIVLVEGGIRRPTPEEHLSIFLK